MGLSGVVIPNGTETFAHYAQYTGYGNLCIPLFAEWH